MTQSTKAMKQFREGKLGVSILPNVVTRDGETQTFHSALASTTYTAPDGQMRNSSSFTLAQIPVLIRLLQAAYDTILVLDGNPSDDLREYLNGGKKAARAPKRNGQPPAATPVEMSSSARSDSEGTPTNMSRATGPAGVAAQVSRPQ